MAKKVKFILLSLIFMISSCSKDEVIIIENENANSINEQGINAEILTLVNEHRKNIGKSSLSRNSIADNIAAGHTNYMILQNEISHDNFNARFEELQQKVNASSAGENVASGFSTAQSVMDAWLNSSGHKANIEGDFTHIGISAIKDSQGRYYYTQLFYR